MYLKDKFKNVGLYFAKKLAILIDFSVFLSKRVKSDALTRVAASLSYTSLLAIVPLFAIGLAIFAAFPMFAESKVQLQEYIIHNFLPEMGDEVIKYFNDFINASAKLTTIGVAGIAVTAILLLSTIEGTFNFLFKVTKPRRLTTKLTLYWTIITLGPLLMGTAFSLRGYMTLNKFMPDALGDTQLFFSAMIPSLLNIILLVAIFMLVPNKKVNITNAIVGAIVTVLLFAIIRSGFASVLFRGTTYKTLYGALATVPILLVWLYTSWAVVLFGAAVTAALEEYRNKEKQQKDHSYHQKRINNRSRNYQKRDDNRQLRKDDNRQMKKKY